MIGVLFGVTIFLAGLLLMYYQWRTWEAESDTARTKRERRFFYRKFKRRTLVAAMIALIGAMISTYFSATDPNVKVSMIAGVLLMLLPLIIFACVDAVSVYLHFGHQDRKRGREELVKHIQRAREIAARREESNESTDDPSSETG